MLEGEKEDSELRKWRGGRHVKLTVCSLKMTKENDIFYFFLNQKTHLVGTVKWRRRLGLRNSHRRDEFGSCQEAAQVSSSSLAEDSRLGWTLEDLPQVIQEGLCQGLAHSHTQIQTSNPDRFHLANMIFLCTDYCQIVLISKNSVSLSLMPILCS